MNTKLSRKRAAAVLAAAVAAILPACGRSASPIPQAEVARAALETSLTAWRDGKKPTDTTKNEPPVQSVDSDWNNGKKLGSFEILREEPSDTDKRFVVKLKYASPPSESEVTYVVLATQPVAVFREDDFTRTLNMDNNPTGKTPFRPGGRRR
jgi:hypothetical protein